MSVFWYTLCDNLIMQKQVVVLKFSALFAKMNYALDLKERYLIWIIVRIDG